MIQIKSLLNKLPALGDARMVSNGFCVWVGWKTEVNRVVPHTLADYGGLLVSQDRRQSLWFFFNTDAFLALARLEVWARLNPVPMFAVIMPAKLLLGMKLEVTVSMESRLASQEFVIPDEFLIMVHQKASVPAKSIPGLSFEGAERASGLAPGEWTRLSADPRLPYQSSLGWYMVMKPLGNPLDKAFQAGWREFFPEVKTVLDEMKLQYLIHDVFVMFPIENLRQLKSWCRGFLALVRKLKEEDGAYWPSVLALVDKKGLNLNSELPRKMSLDWDQLAPDFPHMNYRTAFLLGEGFKINDVRFTVDQASVEDWCNVALSGERDDELGTLEIELPKRLVTGKHPPCFYCGMRNHPLTECPSRNLTELAPRLWEQVARLDFDMMKQGLIQVDETLKSNPDEAWRSFFSGKSVENIMVQAVFEINAPVQHRMARVVWRSMGKDYPKGIRQLGPRDDNEYWEALDLLKDHDQHQADRILSQSVMKRPRYYQPRTVQGFSALEKGDPVKAMALWKEAETMVNTPLQQAYVVFLQARLLEMEGRLQNASAMYRQVLKTSPRWRDAAYRQGVCLVKMGFAEQAMSLFDELIEGDPNLFNRLLLDPELERGHIHLLSAMYSTWLEAENLAAEEEKKLEDLRVELGKWFPDDHPFTSEVVERISNLRELEKIKNYVAFKRLVSGRTGLNRDLSLKTEEESKKLRGVYESFMERLKIIRDEASWFPFPKILIDFNRDFNNCARMLNWALRQHFQLAENFRKATEISEKVEQGLEKLEKRLKTLKIVRDATLFLLIMGKTFFWLELTGLLLSLLLLPLTVYYGQKMGYSWASGLLVSQKWEIQKGMIIILSVLALAVSVLKTSLVFESKKRKLFKQMELEEKKGGAKAS